MTSNELKHQAKIQEWGLAIQYEKKGNTTAIVELLEPFRLSKDKKTRSLLLPILCRAYESDSTKYMLQLSELKREMQDN